MKNDRLNQLAIIVSGLAASGHYTQLKIVQDDGDEIENPTVRGYKTGYSGAKSRHFHIVDDALRILKHLELELSETPISREESKTMRVSEIAKITGLHPVSIRRAIKRGDLGAISSFRHKIISKEAVNNLIKNKEDKHANH